MSFSVAVVTNASDRLKERPPQIGRSVQGCAVCKLSRGINAGRPVEFTPCPHQIEVLERKPRGSMILWHDAHGIGAVLLQALS